MCVGRKACHHTDMLHPTHNKACCCVWQWQPLAPWGRGRTSAGLCSVPAGAAGLQAPRSPPGKASRRSEPLTLAYLLHVGAGDACVVELLGVAPAGLLARMGEGAVTPIMHETLAAGHHLRRARG